MDNIFNIMVEGWYVFDSWFFKYGVWIIIGEKVMVICYCYVFDIWCRFKCCI